MESSMRELADYRMKRAEEMLDAAKDNLNMNQFRTSLNRSYYAIFHAMRAANILEGYDSSKHSGVIAFFTKTYLKTELFDGNLSQIIKEASYLREKSDYDDFYVAVKEDVKRQLENAERFVSAIKKYMETQK